MRDAHVARGRLEIERELAHQPIDVAERAGERLAHRPQCQARMREREPRAGRHLPELACEDLVERSEAAVAECIAIALRRILHPVALGPLCELDEPRGQRLGLGRHGEAGGQVQLAHLLAQPIHVGIPALNWPSALSTQRMACSVSETQPG